MPVFPHGAAAILRHQNPIPHWMENYDAIVIGAQAIGCSGACHVSRFDARRTLVPNRGLIGSDTTSQSPGILRTRYPVSQSVDQACACRKIFERFVAYLDDEEVSAGLVRCGYLIAAPDGEKVDALRALLEVQRSKGIRVEMLDRKQAAALLPIACFDDAALIGFEPDAGFADAYLVATSLARAARRLGLENLEGVEAHALLRTGRKVTGVETSRGKFQTDVVVSAQNIWARDIQRWTGIPASASASASAHRRRHLPSATPRSRWRPRSATPRVCRYSRTWHRQTCRITAATAMRRCSSVKAAPARDWHSNCVYKFCNRVHNSSSSITARYR